MFARQGYRAVACSYANILNKHRGMFKRFDHGVNDAANTIAANLGGDNYVHGCDAFADGSMVLLGSSWHASYPESPMLTLSRATAEPKLLWGPKPIQLSAGVVGSGYGGVLAHGSGVVTAFGRMQPSDTSRPPAPFVVRTAPNGNVVWDRALFGDTTSDLRAAVEVDAGHLLLGGYQASATGTNRWRLVKMSGAGKVIWDRIGPAHGGLRILALETSTEGTVGLLGSRADSKPRRPVLARINADGAWLWERSFPVQGGTATPPVHGGLVAMADGGFAFAASVARGDHHPALLVRTDRWGHAGCDISGKCLQTATKTCDDANSCTADACAAAKGCTNAPLANAIACHDGNACSVGDVCAKGVCKAGLAKADCDDDNACTIDSCDADLGCLHVANAAKDGQACKDKAGCHAPGLCASGACKGQVKVARWRRDYTVGGWLGTGPVARLSDGGWLVGGAGLASAPLLKADADGELMWTAHLKFGSYNKRRVRGLVAGGGGAAILALEGEQTGHRQFAHLVGLNAQGRSTFNVPVKPKAGAGFHDMRVPIVLLPVPNASDVLLLGWDYAITGAGTARWELLAARYSSNGGLVSAHRKGGLGSSTHLLFSYANGEAAGGPLIYGYTLQNTTKKGYGLRLTWHGSTAKAMAGTNGFLNALPVLVGTDQWTLMRGSSTGVDVRSVNPGLAMGPLRSIKLGTGTYTPLSAKRLADGDLMVVLLRVAGLQQSVVVARIAADDQVAAVTAHTQTGGTLAPGYPQPMVATSDGGAMVAAGATTAQKSWPVLLKVGPKGRASCP